MGAVQDQLREVDSLKRKLVRARKRAAQMLGRPVGLYADISQYQPTIDGRAYAAKHDLIVIKVSEGRTWLDPEATDHVAEMRRLFDSYGVLVQPYHFARPENNAPEDEARFFVAACRDLGLRLGRQRALPARSELPGVLDYEVAKLGGGDDAWVAAFTAAYRRLTDHSPWHYGGAVYRERGVANRGCPVWVPTYGRAPLWPPTTPAKHRVAWQFTDGLVGPDPHRLAGLPANHDVNRFLGDTRKLLSLAT